MGYSPTVGRWLEPDPAKYKDGASLYLYVRANPIGLLDPLGLWSIWDGLQYLPVFGTVYKGYVPSPGTNAGDYNGWDGKFDAWKCECRTLGAEAAKANCEKRIWGQFLKFASQAAGVPLFSGVVGDFAGIFAAIAAKKAGIASEYASGGVTAVLALDAGIDGVLTIKNVNDMRKAAQAAMKLQCKCGS
jgi:hypothetical protein